MFFEVPDWNTELRERDRLFRDIVRLADALGVQFAFPTQTVHLFKEEHAPHQRRHHEPTATSDDHASAEGIRAAKAITRQQPYVKHKPDPVVIQADATLDDDYELDAAGNPVEKPDDDSTTPAPPFPTAKDTRPNDLKGGS